MENTRNSHSNVVLKSTEDCAICLDKIQERKMLKCLHSFCSQCIDSVFRFKPACPICNTYHGVYTGTQPEGTMTVTRSWQRLPGFEHCGCIVIQYSFPAGIQGHGARNVLQSVVKKLKLKEVSFLDNDPKQTSKFNMDYFTTNKFKFKLLDRPSQSPDLNIIEKSPEHPNPGVRYSSTSRTAYLPACEEGEKVLKLLRKAFDRRLVFTIGQSATTGLNNVITWNDIHHKTNVGGGPQCFGYPDPAYLFRVQEELRLKGVTEED